MSKDAIAELFKDTLQALEEAGNTPEFNEIKKNKSEKQANIKKENEKPKKKDKKVKSQEEKPPKEETEIKKPLPEEIPSDESTSEDLPEAENDSLKDAFPFPEIGSPSEEIKDAPEAYDEEEDEDVPPQGIPSAALRIPALEDMKPVSDEAEEEEGEITNPRTFEKSSKRVGETVDKEYVEKLKKDSEKPKNGYRGTLIIHTRTVDTEGNPVSAPVPEEPGEKEGTLSLVRKDTGEIFPLDKNLRIGRDLDNDIVIPNPEGHCVSGHHADISISGKEVRLIDASSLNGTFVNKSKIKEKVLFAGNRVKFADIEFEVIKG